MAARTAGERRLRALHLCSGYGGFELAFRLEQFRSMARVQTVGHVERDAYAAAVLVARMGEARLDQAPVWDHLETFDGEPWRGRVDLVTAGFPCQPFSSAGRRRGVDDDRWLWPEIARVIGDVGPRWVILENVPGVVRHGLPHVLQGLADLGFDAEWGLLAASAVGAPHRRERFWLVARMADTDDARREGPGIQQREPGERRADVADAACVNERESNEEARALAWDDARADVGGHSFPPPPDDHDGWSRWVAAGGPEPAIRRSADGPPVGLADALHLGGNGLVPQCAAEAVRQLLDRAGWGLTP